MHQAISASRTGRPLRTLRQAARPTATAARAAMPGTGDEPPTRTYEPNAAHSRRYDGRYRSRKNHGRGWALAHPAVAAHRDSEGRGGHAVLLRALRIGTSTL